MSHWARGDKFPWLMMVHHSISIFGSPAFIFQLLNDIRFATIAMVGLTSASCIVWTACFCEELHHSKKTVFFLRTFNLVQHVITRFLVLPLLTIAGGVGVWGAYTMWC